MGPLQDLLRKIKEDPLQFYPRKVFDSLECIYAGFRRRCSEFTSAIEKKSLRNQKKTQKNRSRNERKTKSAAEIEKLATCAKSILAHVNQTLGETEHDKEVEKGRVEINPTKKVEMSPMFIFQEILPFGVFEEDVVREREREKKKKKMSRSQERSSKEKMSDKEEAGEIRSSEERGRSEEKEKNGEADGERKMDEDVEKEKKKKMSRSQERSSKENKRERREKERRDDREDGEMSDKER